MLFSCLITKMWLWEPCLVSLPLVPVLPLVAFRRDGRAQVVQGGKAQGFVIRFPGTES